MLVSTKGRYATRMLIDIALNQANGYVPMKDIAKRQEISKKYLEQIVPVLNKSRILQTNRGFQGGYRLAVSPDKVTVGDVLRLTEGSLSPLACIDDDNYIECSRRDDCATLFVWQGLKHVIDEYLDNVTLRDILDHKRESYSNDYVI